MQNNSAGKPAALAELLALRADVQNAETSSADIQAAGTTATKSAAPDQHVAECPVQFQPGDRVYGTDYPLEQTAAAVIAAVATAICDIWQLKSGRAQCATIAMRAAAAALESYRYLERRDEQGHYQPLPTSSAATVAYQITRPFLARDGRWFLPHFGMLHLKSRMQTLLQCDDNVSSVAAAVARWDADELEHACAEQGLCGGTVRTATEWLEHPQGQALRQQPVISIEKIGHSDPEPFRPAGAPLHGVRILDLTRILAGPVAARSCAEHGADVLMVAAKHTPQIKNFVMDLSHGKRSTWLDIDQRDDAARLKQLVQGADVFSQGYRSGVLAKRGFGPHELAAIRPGLVYLSTSCYGQVGPWSDRAGWEQVAQSVSGICHRVNPAEPELLPVNACDYLTGYLGAYGILLALLRRAIEGGSYHVNVSLCQSAMLLNRQPVSVPTATTALTADEVSALQMHSNGAYGALRHLAPVAQFSDTPADWRRAAPALGGDEPVWLPSHKSFS
jgi:crotonobetainyl-CoA:carnitine CoA-transferase CaiB-like acyl-CoA transferase